MELVDLYNENRLPLGKTGERREARLPGEYQMIVHVCVFNSKGQMLIPRRSEEKLLWAGLWDVSVAGGVDAGESSRQAAEREFREELGFSLDLGDKRPTFTLHIPKGFDDYYVLEKDIDLDDLSLQREEVSAVRWADRDEVLKLLEDGLFVPYQPLYVDLLFAVHSGEPVVKR